MQIRYVGQTANQYAAPIRGMLAMAVRIKDLSDAHLKEAYQSYLGSDTSNWTVGLGLLLELSRRFGNGFEKDAYVAGLKRVISIKPSLKGREDKFFPENFVIPLPELKALINELTSDVCLAAIENVNIQPL